MLSSSTVLSEFRWDSLFSRSRVQNLWTLDVYSRKKNNNKKTRRATTIQCYRTVLKTSSSSDAAAAAVAVRSWHRLDCLWQWEEKENDWHASIQWNGDDEEEERRERRDKNWMSSNLSTFSLTKHGELFRLSSFLIVPSRHHHHLFIGTRRYH